MIQLSPYGERIVDRINMIGMWISVLVSVRNFMACYRQWKRTQGKIHLVNMAQVVVFFIHRFLFGLIPLFEITTCAFFPLLVSLWHIAYILFYAVMFMRLVILESDRHALWIKVAGGFLIALRFADWPYELAFYSLQADIMKQEVLLGATCLTQWGSGVIVLNFVADVLANLFLSGMFVRRLYMHISTSKSLMSQHNRVIEYIARKSLLCLTLTFVVNLTMNLLKVTEFMGDRSDSFTVYFQLIESTLLVEALRVDYTRLPSQAFCENCGMAIRYLRSKGTSDSAKRSKSRTDEQNEAIDLKQVKAPPEAKTSNQFHHPLATFAAQSSSNPFTGAVRETTSAPNFALGSRPLRSGEIPVDATASFSMERPSRLADRPEWSNNDYRMFK